jgi:hypothetical protein
MQFRLNKGLNGACFQIDSNSEWTDNNSKYIKNRSTLGGVVYAINDSKFKISNAIFQKNLAQDGSVLYSLYNSGERALVITNSQFLDNISESNLMQIMSSQVYIHSCSFLDNYSTLVNHGITLISATTEVYNSTIRFTPEEAKKREDSLEMRRVDTGFFSLFLTSILKLGEGTVIENLIALNNAVMSAVSMSSLEIFGDVKFKDNRSMNL